ncbi:acetyl-mannosamine transferase [Tateyamaria omphalii]|uniref:WecB/TagA/CpsF family glycosyltransferase n=1 Tax=Tateyamaria omphalii TaxID=299262 RepID=UPI0016760FAE|nr:WecB/TagA/CpsF family glycosyltransferase [Tateyamaria omphalii]GGX48620.1 acetyl-mannosamine transferase [Tateyamaria omphalii]
MIKFSAGDHSVKITIPSSQDLETAVGQCFDSRQGFALATLNLDHVVKLNSDKAFQDAYAQHEFVTADGNPIVWLSRLAGSQIELLPGSDLMLPLLKMAARYEVPVAFVGSTEAALKAAAIAVKQQVPDIDIRHTIAPPFGFDPEGEDAARILDLLAKTEVGLCFVALGAPKQERFAAFGRRRAPDIGFASIGAGIDFLAGHQTRAPAWVRRMSMEWLWRAARSPRRLAMRYARCIAILPKLAYSAISQRNNQRV